MNEAEVIKLAVAAMLGAFAKELVSLIFSNIRNAAAVKNALAAFKVIFSPANRTVIGDLLVLGIYIFILYDFASNESSASNLHILVAIGACFACLFMVVFLFVDIYKAQQKIETRDGT
jgi:uncharacterized membrane protein YesL